MNKVEAGCFNILLPLVHCFPFLFLFIAIFKYECPPAILLTLAGWGVSFSPCESVCVSLWQNTILLTTTAARTTADGGYVNFCWQILSRQQRHNYQRYSQEAYRGVVNLLNDLSRLMTILFFVINDLADFKMLSSMMSVVYPWLVWSTNSTEIRGEAAQFIHVSSKMVFNRTFKWCKIS